MCWFLSVLVWGHEKARPSWGRALRVGGGVVDAGAGECQPGTIAGCGSSATRAVNSAWTIAGRASASSIRRSARRVIGIPSARARKYNRVTRSRRSCGEYHFARGMDRLLMVTADCRDEMRRRRSGGSRDTDGASQIHITWLVRLFHGVQKFMRQRRLGDAQKLPALDRGDVLRVGNPGLIQPDPRET